MGCESRSRTPVELKPFLPHPRGQLRRSNTGATCPPPTLHVSDEFEGPGRWFAHQSGKMNDIASVRLDHMGLVFIF